MARSKWMKLPGASLFLTTPVAFSLQGEPLCNVPVLSNTWTSFDDFDAGFGINTALIDDPFPDASLTIREAPDLLDDIWVACSERGTIVRINTVTRQILGEYFSSPNRPTGAQCPHDPSRTTVDFDGNVWAGNRENPGTVVKIGSGFGFQWVDRNNNGILDTSQGLGDVRDWDEAEGGFCLPESIDNAEDELILPYGTLAGVRTARHVTA